MSGRIIFVQRFPYITYPAGKGRANLPVVLNVHGGPWYRDTWGYNPEAQWLANRGYVCLQVNFRGSTGYGKDFLNAGNSTQKNRKSGDRGGVLEIPLSTLQG